MEVSEQVKFKTFVGGLTVLGALLWPSCNSDLPTQSRTPISDLSLTPRADQEAELAAMWFSQEVVAPQWLYERIRTDLESIRGAYGDSLPVNNVTFWSFWFPSVFLAHIIMSELDDPASGGRQMFDSLNNHYRMYEFDTARYMTDWYYLNFKGVLNPLCLMDIYSHVPGIKTRNALQTPVGDAPQIYFYPSGENLLYFFRDAWGDCPSGCMGEKFYYFKSRPRGHRNDITYLGSYEVDWNHPDLAPAWYDTAKLARAKLYARK